MHSIRLDGDVKRLLKHLGKLENIKLKDAGLTLAEVLRTSTQERFQKQEAPDGKRWQQSIRAKETGTKTLSDTAALRRSIRSKSDSTGGFAVGTNKIYAATHQFGEKARVIKAKTKKGLKFRVNGKWVTKSSVKIRIPKREFLGISDDDMNEIKETINEMVAEGNG